MERTEEIAALRRRLAELEAEEGPAPSASSISHPPPKEMPRWAIIGGCAVILLIVLALSSSNSSPATTGNAATDQPLTVNEAGAASPAAAEANSEASSPAVEPANWTYRDVDDAMTDKPTHFACTTSVNSVNLNPPYQNVDARLCVRRSSKFGLDTFVELNGDGQILCRSYEGCTVHVRYDQRPRQAVSGTSASDGSSNIVFLNSASRIVEQLRNSKRMLVELEFYEAGNQTLEFNTADFKWSSAKAPTK